MSSGTPTTSSQEHPPTLSKNRKCSTLHCCCVLRVVSRCSPVHVLSHLHSSTLTPLHSPTEVQLLHEGHPTNIQQHVICRIENQRPFAHGPTLETYTPEPSSPSPPSPETAPRPCRFFAFLAALPCPTCCFPSQSTSVTCGVFDGAFLAIFRTPPSRLPAPDALESLLPAFRAS